MCVYEMGNVRIVRSFQDPGSKDREQKMPSVPL